MFKTQYDSHGRVFSNAGSREKILYQGEYDDHGNVKLVEVGKENLYDFIQSHKDSCDINVIVRRYAAGDASVLSRRQMAYGDFTVVPKTYAEMLNLVMSGEKAFNDLPLVEREKYGHSFEKWLVSHDFVSPGTGDVPAEKEPVVKEEVLSE